MFRFALLLILLPTTVGSAQQFGSNPLKWETLPPIPDKLGVAGPLVGVHNDALIVAGGANFPLPVWETTKQWHDKAYVLADTGSGYEWKAAGKLLQPLGYAACVSTPLGIVCMGGNDATNTYADVFLLRWHPENDSVELAGLPPLPRPCAHGQAALIGNSVYLAGGQSGAELSTALSNFGNSTCHGMASPTCNGRSCPVPWPASITEPDGRATQRLC